MAPSLRTPSEAAAPALGRLARLPVFLDLGGRGAVVVGGGPGAAWKAELLAASGAAVTVVAPEPSAEMVALAARGAAAGSITIAARAWVPDDFTDAAIVVADVEDADEADAARAAARCAGAIFNAVDRPAQSDVEFGAIVNRSPVVVGISTAGAAPILAQAVRRRIETLLPPSLAPWAEAASRLRATIHARLLPAARRAVFERLADAAFREPAADVADAEAALAAMVDEGAAATPQTGSVTLVGAGPGDAELLTLKAVRAMQAADVILFDDLVSDEVLELARREAKRLLVGKRGGRASCRQEDINALMVTLARQGKRVVRLKSGDPMVFGRGGEEIEELERAGIPVSVVPGITAALAAAARLGVSLTHRDAARSVRFITGHARDGRLPADLDWPGLADPRTTLMVYMGGRTAGSLAGRLIAAGLSADTPCVAVASVSTSSETRWIGPLGDLGGEGARVSGEGPILIGIGAVFAALLRSTRQLGGLEAVSRRHDREAAAAGRP
jgi:uroporphyrin-III C-methyltransferase/precorrin-2 dehydrogenase/sirohydrochlorin ferrochelatase